MDKKNFLTWVAKLHANYKPNKAVLQKLQRLQLVAFVGPTGVGKTTLMQQVGFPHVNSDVTRPQRADEKPGEEYFFRSDYGQMLQEIKTGEYAQFVVNHNGEFYGTRGSSYPESGFCAMAILAQALPQFQSLNFAGITPLYILPPSYVDWMHRIGSDRSSDLQARFAEARTSLPKALADPKYHFILNDTVEEAVADIKTILDGKPINEHRAILARQTAELLIGRLGDSA